MRDVIIGTAGHIDHGKTALVRALTGIDTDRLQEEKRRGITIDIGFAHTELGPYRVGFIDVPGHEKFVKNMLAGIGGIDVALLVVAANESVMPQTLEHFEICRLLEIPRGLVAITKKNQADQELLELVREEIRDLTRGSFLENAPVVAVDSLSGEGIPDLKRALLDEVLQGCEREAGESGDIFRMPIDRVFTIRGFGTVVTGTPTHGRLAREAPIAVYPAGRVGKVRGIEVFNREQDEALAGQRTALNLTGLEKGDLQRGMVLAPPGAFEPSYMFDVMLSVLDGAPRPLKNRGPVRFHHGSAELIGRVYLLEGTELSPGRTGAAQVRLDTPTVACPSDRFIIRSYSPATTIGGGVILDALPPKIRRSELPERVKSLHRVAAGMTGGKRLNPAGPGPGEGRSALDAALLTRLIDLAGSAGLSLRQLSARLGRTEAALRAVLETLGDVTLIPQDPLLAVSDVALANLQEKIHGYVRSYDSANPLTPGVPREELKMRFLPRHTPVYFQFLLDTMEKSCRLQAVGSQVVLYGMQTELTPRQREIQERVLAEIRESSFQPPSFDELAARLSYNVTEIRDVFHYLLKRGELVRVTTEIVLLPDQVAWLKEQVRDRFPKGTAFAVTDFKEIINVSRKYAIPYLEYLDRERVTRRAGEKRIVL